MTNQTDKATPFKYIPNEMKNLRLGACLLKFGYKKEFVDYVIRAVNSHDEFLEAAKWIIQKCVDEKSGKIYPPPELRINELKKAIAKAEGK